MSENPSDLHFLLCSKINTWVKSGHFEHQVNSDIHLQTVEIQMRRLLMSRLIRIFTFCLVNSLFYSNNQTMKQTRSLIVGYILGKSVVH